MRKKFMAALSAAAILAVSGCSSSAKVTLGPAGGTQVSEIERYNAYIDANNVIINELDDAIYSYFSYVEYQEEFKALDPDYWCLPVSDYSLQIMDSAYDIANSMETKEDIDSSYITLYPVMRELADKLNEVYDYTEMKSYIDDNYAKGAELHKIIYNDYNQYYDLSYSFLDLVTEMAEAQIAEEMEYYKSEGLEVMYSLNSVLLKAKEIQAAIYDQNVYDDNLIELDTAAIQPLYDEYIAEIETCFSLLDSPEKLEKEGLSTDNPYIGRYKEEITASKVALTDLFQRVAEQRPLEEYELYSSFPADGSVSSFDEALSNMIDYYNSLIDYQ